MFAQEVVNGVCEKKFSFFGHFFLNPRPNTGIVMPETKTRFVGESAVIVLWQQFENRHFTLPMLVIRN